MRVRIKYFPKNDQSYGYFLNRVPQVYFELKEKNDKNLIDYLELFEISRYLNDDVNNTSWPDDFKKNLQDIRNKVNQTIGRYFNNKEIKLKIINEVKQINYESLDSLIKAAEKYKFLKEVSGSEFNNFINMLEKNHLRQLLTSKLLTRKFSYELTENIIANKKNAELVIDSILNDKSSKATVFIPESFTSDKRDKLFIDYINQESPNLNYLKIIDQARFDPSLDEQISLKAKRKYEEIELKHFQNQKDSGITTVVNVLIKKFSPDKAKIVKPDEKESNILTIKLNKNFLDESQDYASVLQNLIYVLGLVDDEFKFSALVNNEEDSTFDRILLMSDKDSYPVTQVFKYKEMIYLTLIRAYIDYLNQNDLYIEQIFKWFFEKYLPTEFSVNGFNIKIPNPEDTYYEKNLKMSAQFHRVLKQYNLYKKYGEIDKELVERIQVPRLSSLPSLYGGKYIYINSRELQQAANIIFSDQSGFGYNENSESPVHNRLIEGIPESSFGENNLRLRELIKQEILVIEKGSVKWKSLNFLYLLKNLFYKRSTNYYYLNRELKELVNRLLDVKNIRIESKLFSQEESEYLDYYLTDRYSNGPGIRNNYMHGSTEDLSEEDNKQNYYILIYLFCLLVININEEFDYRDKGETS